MSSPTRLVLVAGAVLALAACGLHPPPPEGTGPDPTDPTATAAATTQTVTVEKVTDGDTFVTTTGHTIRVLGIDSCEATTPGGHQATAAARARLLNQPVTLTDEPGVDLDPYGRQLRYVQTRGHDFGMDMVGHPHTSVYTGRNDASPHYIAQLRTRDTDGRNCTRPAPADEHP